ncbi:(-)-isopiperitenol/(-)-carveol dehydrogenase, mitochondrial [Sesamum alatum]|uniref:(-)-isopiperitenol/(-)-carveol dehydrogenase, mitochondrial n=1 Tax=Sesamum alatum TaxID=300844 RepID=A0AAE1YVY2_9LAMI|nr:(-)-isopiperitenol/(-)-carveol dehydrogenase, mitochondrial [Sesamum alatum]
MADTQSISLKKKLQGKVAIVTGGAGGIGEAAARLFAEHGALAVVIADIQAEKGQSVAESIGLQRCSYVQCDVADEEQVKSMVEWTVKTYGGLDIMFSNAGILGSSDQTILDLDLSQYDAVMRVNARGMAVCVKQVAGKMTELGTKGAIVCTSSAVVVTAVPTFPDYTMSKHAVLGLVRAASQQLGAHGIRINCVSPSALMTPLVAKGGLTAGDLQKMIDPWTSLKGVALTAEHVAEAALFLASDESVFITGHNLVVDGGLKGSIG